MGVEQIKQSIFMNVFMDNLRGRHIIDLDAFDELCVSLRKLALIWHTTSQIDKELVAEIHTLSQMTLYQWLSPSWEAEEREQIWKLYIELDNLITECLV